MGSRGKKHEVSLRSLLYGIINALRLLSRAVSVRLEWCGMLKAVITSLKDISASLVNELVRKHVSVSVTELRDGETTDMWLKRLLAWIKEQGLRESECLMISSDRECLVISKEAGLKCVGYLEQSGPETEMLGYCTYAIEGWEGIDFSYINRVFCRLEGIPLVIAVTKHLLIRELVQEDIPCLCKICSQDSVRAFIHDIGEDLQEEAEKHKAYIEQAYRFYDYGYWGVYNRQSGELIGRCGIQDNVIDGVAEVELGYLLAEEHRGKGYAKEAVNAVLAYAFRELGLLRVVAEIDKDNTASLQVAKNCGMLWEKDIVKIDAKNNMERICSVYAITPVSGG